MNTHITANDILQQRETARRAGLLAHTPNAHGYFNARLDCSCYTCRDFLDPTGEEDASQANTSRQPPLKVSIPEPQPKSTTCPNSPHPPPPSETHKPVCCQRSPLLNLPIPPRAHRQPTRSESESSDLVSPISLPDRPFSPTNLSFNFSITFRPAAATAAAAPDNSAKLEKDLLPKIETLLETYQAELLEVENSYEQSGIRLDEIAALDQLWNEIDRKIDSTRTFLKLIKKKV